VIGLGLGVLSVVALSLPPKWSGALVLAVIAPVVVLLVRDLKKLVLVAIIVTMPSGFDVSILNRTEHQGGPGGYVVSLLTFALIAGYVMWITERPKTSVRSFKPMTFPLLAFILLALISVFQSVDSTYSLAALFLLIQAFLMYFYIVNHVTTWDDFRLIINVIAACLALEGVLMALQYFTGLSLSFAGVSSHSLYDASESVSGIRVGGTFGSSNGASIWLTSALAITMGAYLLYSHLKLRGRHLLLLAFLLGTVGLLVTFSRSGWISFALAMLILGALAIKRDIATTSLILMVLIAFVIGGLSSDLIVRRFTGDDQGSAAGRRIYAEMAFKMIDDHPLGVGINNFDERKMRYLPVELFGQPSKWVYVVHNHYLLVWAEMGLQGLVALVVVLLAAIAHGISGMVRQTDPRGYMISTSLLAALIGYSLHMASDIFSWPETVLLLWLVIALITAANNLSSGLSPGGQGASTSS
jgi:O-antigen ligase